MIGTTHVCVWAANVSVCVCVLHRCDRRGDRLVQAPPPNTYHLILGHLEVENADAYPSEKRGHIGVLGQEQRRGLVTVIGRAVRWRHDAAAGRD